MDLRTLLNFCRGEHSDDWVLMPGGGPGRRVLTGFIDVAGSRDPPALTVLQASHRAVYEPDPAIGLAWGFHDEGWRDRNEPPIDPPEWAPEGWSRVEQRFAVVLLNGAIIWQLPYAYVNWGSGIDGLVPWFEARYGERMDVGGLREIIGWETTRWEVEFAELLNTVQGNDGFRFGPEVDAIGPLIDDLHPIDAQKNRLM